MPYRWLLGCWICIVILVTTYPWARYVPSIQWHRINWIPFYGVPILPGDIVANILLFFPLGFFFVVVYRHLDDGKNLRMAFLVSFGLSAGVEILQGFSLTRFPSMTDVIFNVIGGGLGSVAGLWWIKGTLSARFPAPPVSHVPPRRSSKPTKP